MRKFTILLTLILFLLIAVFMRLNYNNFVNFSCKIKQSGVVIVGKKIAQTTGFPTANIPYINNSMDASVFISTIKYDGKIYKGATFYNKQRNILESHILDFNEDIYGKEIEVCLIEKVRDKMKFKSKEDAENQFKKDIQNVKKFFKIKN